MESILIIPIIISFLITLFILPPWIKKAKSLGIIWSNMNSYKKNKVSGSGGLIVILGFILGAFTYIAYMVFFLNTKNDFLVQIFAMISVILILAGIGLIDDLFGWKKGGLRKRTRIILTIVSAIPLIAINAGKSVVSIPIIGQTDLGLIYPLLLIPLGIAGATTTYNFLAGFNGLEAGQGIILLSALSLVSYLTGTTWLAVISLVMVSSLIAFLFFNMYPAQIFPGDVLTYPLGGLIAIVSILGNFEKIAVFFFIPYILETILKSRGGLIKQSFGKPKKDGSIELKYNKIYSLNHLSIYLTNKLGLKATEKTVVYSIWFFQIIIILIGFIIFRKGIFYI